jgi:hypothetical protein
MIPQGLGHSYGTGPRHFQGKNPTRSRFGLQTCTQRSASHIKPYRREQNKIAGNLASADDLPI